MIVTLPVDRLDEARGLRLALYRHHRELATPAGYEPRDADAAWSGWRARAERLLRSGAAELFVEQGSDGELHGLALVRLIAAANAMRLVLAPTGDHAELMMLVVADTVRGGGVGGRLYDAALDWSRGRGAVAMHVDVRAENPDALRFYARQGARPAFVQLMHRL